MRRSVLPVTQSAHALYNVNIDVFQIREHIPNIMEPVRNHIFASILGPLKLTESHTFRSLHEMFKWLIQLFRLKASLF